MKAIALFVGVFTACALSLPTTASAGASTWCEAGEKQISGILDDDYDSIERGYLVRRSDPCAIEYVVISETEGCKTGARFTASGVVEMDIDEDGQNIMSLKASRLKCEEGWFAAVTPNDELSAPVVWGNDLGQVREAALAACRKVSDSCATKPSITDRPADVFALKCCRKPKLGCAAFSAPTKAKASEGLASIFKEAGYAQCMAEQYLSAETGETVDP